MRVPGHRSYYCVRLPRLTRLQTDGYHQLTTSLHLTRAGTPRGAVGNVVFRNFGKRALEGRRIYAHLRRNFGMNLSQLCLNLEKINVDLNDPLAVYVLSNVITSRMHFSNEEALIIAEDYLRCRRSERGDQ